MAITRALKCGAIDFHIMVVHESLHKRLEFHLQGRDDLWERFTSMHDVRKYCIYY